MRLINVCIETFQNKDRSPHKCFLEASECLSRTNHETLKKAVERAKNMLIHIHKTAQSILEMRQVINTGTFLYIALSEGILRCHQFSHPHALTMLAQFVLRAYVENSKHKNAKNWPLVASAMYSEEDKTCLILGIPPVSEDQPKRFVHFLIFFSVFNLKADKTIINFILGFYV